MTDQSHLHRIFKETIQQHLLFTNNDGLLLAVSGGADSVALCRLCHDTGYAFAIAHANFGLRGDESDADEAFVEALARQLGVRFFRRRFDTAAYMEKEKLSLQEAARELRYTWFNELLNEGIVIKQPTGAATRLTRILTAHHAEDHIETMLLNLFKGTGLKGLRGIPWQHGNIVRPLLHIAPADLVAYLRSLGQEWRTDSTNASEKYTRNFIRHSVIPLLETRFPGVRQNLRNSMGRFSEAYELYDDAVTRYRKSLLELSGEQVRIPILKLLKSTPLPTILFELFTPFGFTTGQLAGVQQLLHAQTGAGITSSTHRVVRHGRWLLIDPLAHQEQASVIIIHEGEGSVQFAKNRLSLNVIQPGGPIPAASSEAWLDLAQVTFPLVLRKWKQGDYFYPLGMRKKKKLSRFFIDSKLTALQKDAVWVLETGGRIAWVVGLRIDDRFRIVQTTKKILKISIL